MNFAAIDFETANECRSSVCSVGIVIVKKGKIVDRFYSLINPEPGYYKWFCDYSGINVPLVAVCNVPPQKWLQ